MRSRRLVLFGLGGTVAIGACTSPAAPPAATAERAPERPSGALADGVAPPPPLGPCGGDDFGLPPALEAEVAARFAKRRRTAGKANKQMVASSHRLATEAGLAILRAGGNAADAFVAATLVEDVVLPGVTSTAGLAGVLVYEARTKKVTYVHGGLADPIDPARRWRSGGVAIGKQVLVPGAPAAFAEIAKRFGRRPFAQLVEPAAKLASQGFTADRLYARSIAREHVKLERSTYGKQVFFRDGKPIAEGETIVQAEYGATLRSWGRDPSWFYKGVWPAAAVKLANDNGGALVVRDFETYALEVAAPLHGRFMGHDIYGAGHGGAKLLVTLEALEILRAGKGAPSPSTSAASLETLLQVQRATRDLPLLFDRELVMRGPSSEAEVTKAAAQIAARVAADQVTAPASGAEPGTHSSAVIAVDDEGNVVVGTHTIETLNWGEGLFVGGIPLSTAAPSSFDDPAQAKRRVRIDPLSATIAMKDGAPVAALAVYGTGLHPADVQILDAVLSRGLDAEAAVLEPRVGYYAFDPAANKVDTTKSSVDPRFSPVILCTLKQRGFTLTRSMPYMPPGMVDTGFPTLVTIASGRLRGMTPEMSYIEGVAAGD